jgi:ABC-type branched-subunit amino acid transport system ATPase component/ABC-type branched-subunit amino acid transport system permease subunit
MTSPAMDEQTPVSTRPESAADGTAGAPQRAGDGRRRALRLVLYGLGVLAVLAALRSPYSSQLLAFAAIYALAVAGWNIVSGYAGQVSFGHAAFFGIGAYGAVTWSTVGEGSPWTGMLVGGLVAVVLGLVVGFVSWRLHVRGIYFALILFAVSQLLRIIVTNVRTLGGTTGLYGGVTDTGLAALSFRDPRWFALIAGVMLAAVLAGTARLARSSVGRQMAAVRNDEVAAEASGVDAMRVKLVALGLSAAVTAFAGALYAQLHLFIQPETVFGMHMNLRIILMGFLGGVGALFGPVLGSAAVITVEALTLEAFQGLPGADGVAFGILLLIAVLFVPHGLASIGKKLFTAPRRETVTQRAAVSAPRAAPARAPNARPPLEQRSVVFEAEGLTKRFGGLTVVHEAGIRLREGTVHGLMGPNGAGKTTLLNMLAGAVGPDEGRVCLLGSEVVGLSSHELAHRGVARTFQIPRSSGEMSLYEAVVTAAEASKRSDDADDSARQRAGDGEARDRGAPGLGRPERLRAETVRRRALSRPGATCAAHGRADGGAEQGGGRADGRARPLPAAAAARHDRAVRGAQHEGDDGARRGDHRARVGTGAVAGHTRGDRRGRGRHPHLSREVDVVSLLAVRDLVVERGHGPVLLGLDMDVREGEIVGVLGTNGVGKTTLMETIAGLHRPRSGSILFDGQEIAGCKPREVARRGIRLVPEGRRLFDRLTVEENLRVGAEAAGMPDWRWVLEIFPQLEDRLEHKGGALSGGEQQMVAVGRALVGKPRLLLLDEPTWGLAPLLVEGLMASVRRISELGTTIVLVEQNVDAAMTVAERLFLLAGGRVATVVSREEAEARPEIIESAFLTGA